jgi:DNA (cytosine-5)-methyltransferase 1
MFSGIGGFELGIKRAFSVRDGSPSTSETGTSKQGVESATTSKGSNGASTSSSGTGSTGQVLCVGYSEIDKYAIKVYERHFNGHTNYGDATTINATELPDFDLLVGGFPCQAFSVAGKRLGFNETRGTLFFDIARILKEKQPRHLVLENVKGLLSHDSGRTFSTIIGVLSDLGYFVEWQVLNSKNFGVPQNRERVFIVGHLGDGCERQVFPIYGKNETTIGENVTLIEDSARHKPREYTKVAPTVQSSFGMGGGHVPLVKPAQWRRTEKGKQFRRESQKQGKDLTPFGDGYREIVPKDSDIIGTITSQAIAKDSLMFEGARIRRLTPKECERLQAFPDDWTAGESDTQRYKMCGNAVTVNVVEAVIRGLYGA